MSPCCYGVNMAPRWLPGLVRGNLEDAWRAQVTLSPVILNRDTGAIHLRPLATRSLSFTPFLPVPLANFRLPSAEGSQPSGWALSQRLLVGWQGGVQRARRPTEGGWKIKWMIKMSACQTKTLSCRSSWKRWMSMWPGCRTCCGVNGSR